MVIGGKQLMGGGDGMDVRARAALINIASVPRSLQGHFSRLPWEIMVRTGVHTLDRAQDLKILKLKKKTIALGCLPAHHQQVVWHWTRYGTSLILVSFLMCEMPEKCYQDESRVPTGGTH